MTSNAYDYGKAVPKGEGMPVWERSPSTFEEEIARLHQQVAHLQNFRWVGLRLRTIAKEGNLMINHPDLGFVLVEDLDQYMMERL